MNQKTSGYLALMLILLVNVSLILGCGGADSQSMIAEANDTNIKRVATLYSLYQLRNKLKGPKTEEDLKSFVQSQDPERLRLANIDATNIDELFTSDRDGQAFTIRYGVNTKVRGPSLPVVFETEGVDGKRQVGFTDGAMQEVDSNLYDEMFSGKFDKKAKATQVDERG